MSTFLKGKSLAAGFRWMQTYSTDQRKENWKLSANKVSSMGSIQIPNWIDCIHIRYSLKPNKTKEQVSEKEANRRKRNSNSKNWINLQWQLCGIVLSPICSFSSSLFSYSRSGWKENVWKSFGFISFNLPPVTRHVSTMSSPSSIGPNIVPFSWWPQRFNTNGYSGGTAANRCNAQQTDTANANETTFPAAYKRKRERNKTIDFE